MGEKGGFAPTLSALEAAPSGRGSAASGRQRGLFTDGAPPVSSPARGGAPPTSPELVVEELRRLTPREEKKALDILSGRRPRSSAAAVIAFAAAAAAAGAGTVLYKMGLFRREGILELAQTEGQAREKSPPVPRRRAHQAGDLSESEVSPPEEPAEELRPAGVAAARPDSATRRPGPARDPTPGARASAVPVTQPGQAGASSELPGARAAGRAGAPPEVPTFRLEPSVRREPYVEIGGPLIDVSAVRVGQ